MIFSENGAKFHAATIKAVLKTDLMHSDNAQDAGHDENRDRWGQCVVEEGNEHRRSDRSIHDEHIHNDGDAREDGHKLHEPAAPQQDDKLLRQLMGRALAELGFLQGAWQYTPPSLY